MMRSKRALAILTSLVLAIGTLSVSTFAADNSATAPTSSAAEDACANGHDYELKNEVGPTCTEDGYREEVCSRCGDTRRVEGEKALGHDFSGEGRVTREATTDREGELTFTCLRDDCNETKTEAIPKLEKTAEDTAEAPASSNQSQQDQNQAGQTSQQESAAQNPDQAQNGEAVQNNANTTASDAKNATLSIAGIPVPQEKGTIKAGESKIKFKREGEGNQEEITLTFDDSKLVVNGSSKKQPPEAVIAYTGTGTLNISIEGENTVTGKNSSYGVYAPDGTVKLTGRKGASLDIQAASENSNTIRAKEIVVDDSLEIAGPENNYVYEGSNGMGGTYQTIAVANNGRNMAVSKVTIQDPNAAQKQTDTEDEKEEETKDEEKTDETTDTVDGNGEKKDETSDENDQKDEAVTEDQEEKNTDVPAKNTPNTTKKTALGSSNTQTEGNGESSKSNDSDNNDVNDQDNKSDSNGNEDNQGGSTTTTTGGGTTTRTTTTTTTTEGGTTTGTTTGSGTTTGEGTQTGTGTGSGSGASTQTSTVGDQGTTTVADLLIDGVKISDEKGSVSAGSGKIEYEFTKDGENIKKVTVTLNNAELTSKADAAIYFKGNSEFVIILKGKNKLTGIDHGIFAPFASMTVEGAKNDSLTLVAKNTVGSPAAIAAKKIVIENPLRVVDPATNRVAEITTLHENQSVTYQNVAEGQTSGNAALTVTIQVPEESVNTEHDHTKQKVTIEKVDATCDKDGNIKYYKCRECGKYFSDEAMTKEIAESDTVIKAGHKLERVEKLNKTCTKGGHIEHYKCTVCNRLFSDPDGKKEIKAEDVVIKAGHTWNTEEKSKDNDKGITATMAPDGASITYNIYCNNCEETKQITVALDQEKTELPAKNKDGTLFFQTSLEGKQITSKKKVEPAGKKGYSFTVPQKRNAAVWAKNSKDSLGFTIKRSEYDTITYPEFQNGGSILVDKKKVDSKNYTVEKGSLKITFKPSYLNTLSAGTHTLHVDFGDGSVEEKFTINASSATGNGTAARTTNATTNRTANATTNRTATGSPRTGDTSNWALWIGLIAVSVIAIAAIVFVRKRGKKNEAAATAEADNKADEAGNGEEQG